MKEITEAEYNELRACSQMLGTIGSHVEDFCNEEDTTLVGVLRLLAKYHALQSDSVYHELDRLNATAI